MANRVNSCDVAAIMPETTITEFAPYIIAAHAVVEAHLAAKPIEESTLKEIERWLAAHFASINDPLAKTERTGDATTSFHGNSGLGLDFTPYGQQAKLLDPTGTLTKLGAKKVMFKVM